MKFYCNYSGYNKEDKQSICSCPAKNEISIISEIENNPQKLSNPLSIEEGSNEATNILTLKCTGSLFSKDGLIKNISNYIISISLIYFLLSILLFLKCGYRILINDMEEIIRAKKVDKNQNKTQKTANKKGKNKTQYKNNNPNKNNNNAPPKKLNNKKSIEINNNKYLLPTGQKNNSNILNNNKNIIPIKKKKNNSLFQRKSTELKTKNSNSNKKNNTTKSIPYNNFELNTLDYISAINYDKRTFCQYYIALIRIKHPLLFGLCPIKDYNSMIIKLCILLLSFDIYYVINFIFFNENAIHKLYEDGGKFDIIYFLPQIAISFGISNTLVIIIKFIFLTERNIIQVRNQGSYAAAQRIFENVKRNIVIKHVIFYILGIIFLFFFWMLLSSFGAVYQNAQIILFINTLISFGISCVYPFFYNIIPCIFRLCSLKSKKKDMICIYNFNKFLQVL